MVLVKRNDIAVHNIIRFKRTVQAVGMRERERES